ncbi:aspartate carbamoyltransferase catalytic subunit [Ammonifex thiophilus]|uniref:Aspartate carbamoyltransferase n=1 Tax=Ammonifex thiophilus TaxID=444093 RepID=A0A3D8P1L0_9THEO|nr:aspartate carbamoyltransferase catalytic subunit [Ammonifex thiophilus]RDV81694.1 aspartate carbamoyltransferase catalytic subunit [Ammonifex thiophilus]
MALRRKDLLGLADLSPEEIEHLLEQAEAMREVLEREIKKVPALRGRVVVNLFYEPSTRTRFSFELAAKYLSAETVSVAAATASVVKGEGLLDTARTVEALGADVVVLRHPSAGAAAFLARHVKAAVINAGDGMHEHPTQALLDLFTVKRHKGRIEGLTVTIVGDILHSRVARSNIWGFSKLGARVRVCGPATLIPPGLEELGVGVYYRLEEALEGADVVYILRLQRERFSEQTFLPGPEEYARLYGLNRERLQLAQPDALVMHPGPMNRGLEIAAEVAELDRAVIEEQVTNGVAVRMACLYLLMRRGEV